MPVSPRLRLWKRPFMRKTWSDMAPLRECSERAVRRVPFGLFLPDPFNWIAHGFVALERCGRTHREQGCSSPRGVQ
jgi:hypothetical protein